MIVIRELDGHALREQMEALAEILLDCVAGGASIGFMAGATKVEAVAFFENVLAEVEKGNRVLLGAFDDDLRLVGTVQVVMAAMPNQAHRADIAKLLVRRSARQQGLGTLLMRQVEAVSRQRGRTLLVLDTVTGAEGEKLYERLGWNRVGVIPQYARFSDGRWCDTTVFWKHVPSTPES